MFQAWAGLPEPLSAAQQVLLGREYTQRSDIHSLALVIWEIVSSGKTVKFYTKGGSRDRDRDSAAAPVVHGGLAGALRAQSTSAPGPAGQQVNSAVSYGAVPYAECRSMAEVREKVSLTAVSHSSCTAQITFVWL